VDGIYMDEIKQIKNICVFGVGGVGGYFGGKICHALSLMLGNDIKVFFVVRGKHLEEIRSNGLILNTGEHDGIICRPHAAVDDASLIPPCDLYLICTKNYDLNSAVKSIKDKVFNNTVVMPLLNGIDIYERIKEVHDKVIILPSCVYITSYIEKPGVVTQKGPGGKILFGRDPRKTSYYPEEIFSLFDSVGIEYKWFDDPYPSIWEKYILICSFALVTTRFNVSMGEILDDYELKRILINIMTEIKIIAQKKGIRVSDSIVEKCLKVVSNYPYDTKTSFQRDIEQIKEYNEGDLYGKTIIRLGKESSVLTPYTESVYNELQKGTVLHNRQVFTAPFNKNTAI
jgi:2-dehydropantoate 2-reductase